MCLGVSLVRRRPNQKLDVAGFRPTQKYPATGTSQLPGPHLIEPKSAFACLTAIVIRAFEIMNMSLSCRYAAQCCSRQLRSSRVMRVPVSGLQHRGSRRNNSTEAVNPRIVGIVDQISQLTLLETADLVSSLKVGGPGSLYEDMEAHCTTNSPASTSPTYQWAASPLAPRRLPYRR